MEHLRRKATYAKVISSAASSALLGGGAAFAAGLAKNSVGTRQLKKNAVTTAKIKNGAVTGAKLAVASLPAVPGATRAGTADTPPPPTTPRPRTAGSSDHAAAADQAASAAHAEEATTAATATSADTAHSAAVAAYAEATDGMRLAPIQFTTNGNNSAMVFNGAGLTLTATCQEDFLTFVGTTSVKGEIYASGNFASKFGGNLEEIFEPGKGFDIGAAIGDKTSNFDQGQVVYSNFDGDVVTAQFYLNDQWIFSPGGGSGCTAYGTVEYTG
jgi:hypothetical protein